MNRLFAWYWSLFDGITLLAVRNIKASLRSRHVQVLLRETSAITLIQWHFLKNSFLFIEFNCTLLCSVHWHRLVMKTCYVTASVVLRREHSIFILGLPIDFTSYFGCWNLYRSKMTPFKLWNFFVNRFLRWFVFFKISWSRCLSIAIDEFVEVNHSSIVATQFEDK